MAPAPARAVAHPAAPIPDGKLLDQGRQRRAAPRLRLHAEGVPGEIIQDINLYGEMHRFLPVLAAWVGSRVTELEVPHHPRTHGASKTVYDAPTRSSSISSRSSSLVTTPPPPTTCSPGPDSSASPLVYWRSA